MTPYNKRASDLVKRNKENVDKGIPNEISVGLPKLENLVYGVMQETYYLVAGGTGSGKTKFIDYFFVLKPMSFVKKNPHLPIKVHIIYFSLEISGVMKAINLYSFYIFAKYGVSLTPQQIQSRAYNLSDQELQYVEEAEKWVDSLAEDLEIYDTNLTASKLWAILKEYSNKNGIWTKNEETGEEVYTPNNPYLYTIVIIDHIGNVNAENKKKEIDKISRYLVWFRNKCRFTPVVVQQYNRGIEGMDRIKFNAQTPQLSDLKETGNTSEDCNIALAMFSPLRFRIEEYRGYNIVKLQDRIRTVTILKNREGPAEKTLGYAFYGEVGFFHELPLGKDMTDEDYDKTINFIHLWKKKKEVNPEN